MKQDPQVSHVAHITRIIKRVSCDLHPFRWKLLFYETWDNGDFVWIFLQNADLKKQLHELQAKITALSEKQVCYTQLVEVVFRTKSF